MTEPSSSGPQQPQAINVADLDIPQLRDVHRQLEEELQHLTTSFQQLKAAQAKFRTCLDVVLEISPTNKDRTILVPLTNSLYVPGKLSNTDNVLVDVGTGYYVKKSRAEATKYYTGKVDYMRENIEKLQDTISKKQQNLQYVVSLMIVKEQDAVASSSGKES